MSRRGPKPITDEQALDRYLSRVAVDPFTGCWLYQGARNKDGYAQTTRNGKDLGIHRFVYEQLVRPVPPSVNLHHMKCVGKHCINPLHLEELTHAEHHARHREERWAGGFCRNGHELTEENTYTQANSKGRYCKTCLHEDQRRWYLRRKAERNR